jgi:DNA-binding transcriptional regulator YiaG
MSEDVALKPSKITRLRESLGLTKMAFANLIGVRRETVATWELGTHEPKGAGAKVLRQLFEDSKLKKGGKK